MEGGYVLLLHHHVVGYFIIMFLDKDPNNESRSIYIHSRERFGILLKDSYRLGCIIWGSNLLASGRHGD